MTSALLQGGGSMVCAAAIDALECPALPAVDKLMAVQAIDWAKQISILMVCVRDRGECMSVNNNTSKPWNAVLMILLPPPVLFLE